MLSGLMMNTPLTITAIMRFAEQVYGDREIVSLTSDHRRHCYTYRDAFQRVRQLANALSELGIKPGDRVATLAWNDHRHFELYYAVSCMGAVCHTVNPRLFPEQINFIIKHAEASVLFIDPSLLPLLEQCNLNTHKASKLRRIIVLDAEWPNSDHPTNTSSQANWPAMDAYETLIQNQPDTFDWPCLDEHTASALCYTSGTTGDPKGVLYSHRSTVLHSYALALPDSLGLSFRDVIMPVVPMFHVNAWGLPYAAPMVGAKLVLPGRQMGDSATLTRLIHQEQVTFAAAVPTVWLAMLQYLQDSEQRLPSMERIVVGGAACPEAIVEGFQTQHQVDVLLAWGMTETSPIGTVNSLNRAQQQEPVTSTQRLKQGRPVFGVELKLVNSAGHCQHWDAKAIGEVMVRGPWICSGYYHHSESHAHDDAGWFATGDIASVDEQGYLQITDRTKDVIKSGGEWISSIDLENAAVGHPGIKEAAVIGIPHPKWSERPLLIAVKQAQAQVDRADLLSWLADKVAKWWLPDDVVFVDDLPHTATGKLSKKTLRENFKDYVVLSTD